MSGKNHSERYNLLLKVLVLRTQEIETLIILNSIVLMTIGNVFQSKEIVIKADAQIEDEQIQSSVVNANKYPDN